MRFMIQNPGRAKKGYVEQTVFGKFQQPDERLARCGPGNDIPTNREHQKGQDNGSQRHQSAQEIIKTN